MKNYNLISTASKSKQKIPHCIHGPNLLLEDLNETIPEYRRKYVCSAVRSNECKPFLNFDSDLFKERHFKKRKNFQHRLAETLKMKKEDRKWCVDCSILLLPDELEHHEDHFIKDNLTKAQLRRPTKLISVNVDKKEEAQYLFSDQSLKIILKTILRCKFTHVLCIGCPTIHEQLTINSAKLNVKSFLLDIDARYLQFYSSKQFLCFNMANNYLFEKEKYEQNLNDFLTSSSKLLIISDPPFGIMIPALADTLIRLRKKINYFKREDSEFKMNLMLFHLYFYEKRILSVLPELKMMDYKISYSNHKKMKIDGNSIARLFTDIDGKQIVLKGLDDYKYCDRCERWVHQVSQHCIDCKNCCSKDGKPSAHCAVCDKCVRETYEHCFKCEICTRKGFCKCGGASYDIDEEMEYNSDYLEDEPSNKYDRDIRSSEELRNEDDENVNSFKSDENDHTENRNNGRRFNGFERENDHTENRDNGKRFNSFGRDNNDHGFRNGFKSRSNDNRFGNFRRDGGHFQNRDGNSRFNKFRGNNFRNGFKGRDNDRKFNNFRRDDGNGFKSGFRNGFRSRDNDRKFNNFKKDDNRDFRKESAMTKDDFNRIFFSKESNKSKTPKDTYRNGKFSRGSTSFGNSGFKRSNDSYGDRSFGNHSFKVRKFDD